MALRAIYNVIYPHIYEVKRPQRHRLVAFENNWSGAPISYFVRNFCKRRTSENLVIATLWTLQLYLIPFINHEITIMYRCIHSRFGFEITFDLLYKTFFPLSIDKFSLYCIAALEKHSNLTSFLPHKQLHFYFKVDCPKIQLCMNLREYIEYIENTSMYSPSRWEKISFLLLVVSFFLLCRFLTI